MDLVSSLGKFDVPKAPAMGKLEAAPANFS
jgi:hypothetical protein